MALAGAKDPPGSWGEPPSFHDFSDKFRAAIEGAHTDPEIVSFKSVVCYRTGLAVSLTQDPVELQASYVRLWEKAREGDGVRIEDKVFNDWIVCTTCEIAGKYSIPSTPLLSLYSH